MDIYLVNIVIIYLQNALCYSDLKNPYLVLLFHQRIYDINSFFNHILDMYALMNHSH